MLLSLYNVMSSPPSYHTKVLCKYRVIIGVAVIFFVLFFFNQTYLKSQYFDSNIFTIKYQERLLQPKEAATNLSHLMFVLVGSSRTWRDRKVYLGSWWRPNVTRGNIFFDVEPSEEFQPWSPALPPLKVNEDLKKLKIYPKLTNRNHTRIYRSILENYRLKQDEDVRWYVTGDDDSVFFVDNMVDVLSKYDHTEKHYIGMFSETIKSNFHFSFDMAFGGGGYALSYPLVKALVEELDNCIERYHYIWAVDHLQSLCLADLGVDLSLEKGFHQMDLYGDISGFLSSQPTAPLVSLHHFETVTPLFPGMDRPGSVNHIMKAANVDQSRMLQQSSHTDSSKLEDKLRDTILEKVSNSEKKELKLKDFTWVTNGLNRLFRSRRILSYSYAFAYYMFGEELFKDEMSSSEREMKKNLFEDQQQQLEGNVEKLSQLLEEPFDDFSDDKVMDVRIHVINLSVAVDSLCKKMYECIENDLLGSLQSGIHNIAPYSSKGIEQAAEFHASWSSSKPLDSSGTSGETSRPEKASGSRDSEDMVCSSSKKRPRREGSFTNSKVTLLDLNLPADFIDQN